MSEVITKKDRVRNRWLTVKQRYDRKHQQLFDYMLTYANKTSLVVNVWYKPTSGELGFNQDTINDMLVDFIKDGLIKQTSANWNGIKAKLLIQ